MFRPDQFPAFKRAGNSGQRSTAGKECHRRSKTFQHDSRIPSARPSFAARGSVQIVSAGTSRIGTRCGTLLRSDASCKFAHLGRQRAGNPRVGVRPQQRGHFRPGCEKPENSIEKQQPRPGSFVTDIFRQCPDAEKRDARRAAGGSFIGRHQSRYVKPAPKSAVPRDALKLTLLVLFTLDESASGTFRKKDRAFARTSRHPRT